MPEDKKPAPRIAQDGLNRSLNPPPNTARPPAPKTQAAPAQPAKKQN